MSDSIKKKITKVAEEHRPEGGYGETSWNEGTKTVFWNHADWTTDEQHDAAEAAFLAIDGVENFDCESESNAMEGDGWVQVWPAEEADSEHAVGAGTIPARVHYREAAANATEKCATCSYYEAGNCSMFDATVDPDYVCDEWTVFESDHAITAALPRRHTPHAVPVERHNAILKAGHARAAELEESLVKVLQPMLERAGDQAAAMFRRTAINHLTAGAEEDPFIRDLIEVMMSPISEDDLDRPWGFGPIRIPGLVAAANDVPAGAGMIALRPRPEEAQAIADPDGEQAGELHVTLAYMPVLGDVEAVENALRQVAATHAPLVGEVGGYGQFGEPANVGILLPDVPGLVELRVDVTQALQQAGIEYGRQHGFTAHITVDQAPEPNEMAEMMERVGLPLHFDELLIVRGGTEVVSMPFTGEAPLTASGIPQWTPPAGDEIVDVAALVAQLRTKTDPIREAFVKEVMTPALAEAGISWDVTNPLTAKVLAQAGSQITGIAETTQLNVMRIIREAYTQGLSIPDTATAIQAGMKAASFTRATLIARTELVGAVNGGSLAATKIVSNATGSAYYKKWMTAPGAVYPRHELYPDLDGETVQLDDTFTVGDSDLQFPGDPDGDPGEVCNCRCSMSYTDDAGELTDAAGGIDS